jgi:hypothetical protein
VHVLQEKKKLIRYQIIPREMMIFARYANTFHNGGEPVSDMKINHVMISYLILLFFVSMSIRSFLKENPTVRIIPRTTSIWYHPIPDLKNSPRFRGTIKSSVWKNTVKSWTFTNRAQSLPGYESTTSIRALIWPGGRYGISGRFVKTRLMVLFGFLVFCQILNLF